ncbi:MAG: hypothetical protein V4692_08120 [Bdellovibrionota bacterium]
MKTFLMSILMLSSLTAFAGNEGPSGAPPVDPPVLAKVEVWIPFGPPESPGSVTLTIDSKGRIVREDQYRNNRSVKRSVGKLSTAVVKGLAKAVSAVKPGKLVDPDPKDEGCFDAPTTTYTAINAEGEIQISQKMRCKHFEKENSGTAEQQVESALAAAMNLSHLAK